MASTAIPGTHIFDGAAARKGYALNRMCFSFNEQANREAFRADEEAYMATYGLNPQQAQCFTALFVTRASQMPNGHWKVLQDRRFGGVTFADEVSRTCAIAPRG